MFEYLYKFITVSWSFLIKSFYSNENDTIKVRPLDKSLLIDSDDDIDE